jgi:ABC-type nitrate/sulfonate/bicarbonate transport system substrate-binding protein
VAASPAASAVLVASPGAASAVASVAPSPAAVAAPSGPAVPFRFAFQQGTTSAMLFFVAHAQGFFKDENIAVELIPSSSATGVLVSGVISKSFDGALTGLSTVVTTRQKNVPVTLLGAFLVADTLLVAPEDTQIPIAQGREFAPTLQRLRGKAIGVSGIGGANHLELAALLKGVGIGPDDVTYLDVQPAAVVAALRTKSVDAVYQAPTATDQAVAAGLGRVVFSGQRNGPPEYGPTRLIGSMILDEFLVKNPAFGPGFQRAMEKAVDFSSDARNIATLKTIAMNNQIADYPGLENNISSLKYLKKTSNAELASGLQWIVSAGIVADTPVIKPEEAVAAPSRGTT